jgi:hypothetical protein
MRAAWHQVDRSWEVLVTESRLLQTPVMTELSDLLLRMGRLAWDNPHWTPARADRAPRRPYVPTRLVPERYDVPRRCVTAPAAQFRALRDAYQQARDASVTARFPPDEITIAARAPSMPLALARAAASDQASRGGRPDDNDFLLRAVVIDDTAERLIEQADNVTPAGDSPERRENWQRAVRRAALLADESFPLGPVTKPPADTQRTRPANSPTPPAASRTGREVPVFRRGLRQSARSAGRVVRPYLG